MENEKAIRLTDRISLLLRERDVRHSIFVTYWPQVWSDISEVWIIGGDGTLNWFINEHPDIGLPLSVFAGGTGNDFHWMVYGDMAPEKQVEKILKGSVHPLDAGMCNGRLFLNGVGIGFDGAIVKDLLGKKKLAGKASYLLSILKHIAGYHEKRCTIKMGEEILSQDCFLVSVANARRYGGGFHVAPKASLDDGLLDVNIVGRISPLNRIRYLPVIEKGEHMELDFIKYRHASEVQISCETDLHAHIDGEYLYDRSFEIAILPGRFSFLW